MDHEPFNSPNQFQSTHSDIMPSLIKKDMQLLAQEGLYAMDNEHMDRVRGILEMISAGKRNNKGTGAQKPKEDRKPNAYNKFVSEYVMKIKAEEPDLKSSDRLKKACSLWKTISAEKKLKYAAMAAGSDNEQQDKPKKSKKETAPKSKGKGKGKKSTESEASEEEAVAEPAPKSKGKGKGKKSTEIEAPQPESEEEEEVVHKEASPVEEPAEEESDALEDEDVEEEEASDDDDEIPKTRGKRAFVESYASDDE